MDFEWVNARAKCSAFEVFRQIQEGVEMDVQQRNQQLPPPTDKAFKMLSPLNPSPEKFGVMCMGHNLRDAVDFTCSQDGKILAVHGEKRVEATVTLNAERQCVLVVNGEELENWQFRKLALEDFFRFSN